MGIAPGGIVSHLLVGIAIAVALLVGLVHHVEPPAVAEFVKVLAVGIVARAQEVDIGLFHQADVFLVGGVVHVATGQRMMVVPVYAAQLHILAVDFEHLAHALHAFHSQMIVEVLRHVAFLVHQFDGERVEVGLLCRPQLGLVNKVSEPDVRCVARCKFFQLACNGLAIDFQDSLHLPGALAGSVADGDVGCHLGLREVLVGHGGHTIVGDVHQRTHPQLHLAEDSRQPPHVLVLEVTAVAPAVNLNGEFVAALPDEFRHVKLGW